MRDLRSCACAAVVCLLLCVVRGQPTPFQGDPELKALLVRLVWSRGGVLAECPRKRHRDASARFPRPPLPQEKIAINNEVLACVSNSALISSDGSYGMLKLWLDGVRRSGVKNYMVIAIDDRVRCCARVRWRARGCSCLRPPRRRALGWRCARSVSHALASGSWLPTPQCRFRTPAEYRPTRAPRSPLSSLPPQPSRHRRRSSRRR